MAIDVKRELERICRDGSSSYPPSSDDLNALLARILKGGSAEEFRIFFDSVIENRLAESASADLTLDEMLRPGLKDFPCLVDNKNYEALLSPRWLPRFAKRYLPLLCDTLRRRYGAGWRSGLAEVLANGRIAAEIRAALCGSIFGCEAFALRSPRGFIHLPPLWYYNRDICGRIMDVKGCREHRMIRKICVSRHDGFRASAAMEIGVARDNFAVFELDRELEDRKIDNRMLEHLIRRDAARCFTGLLSRHPGRVFKLRSPAEWLVTVCRYAGDELAVAAVNELERQFPGIVGNTRDPWGNTPLWNTFVNEKPTAGLRKELLRFGCDPDARNEWGLSYQLLEDNDPEKMRENPAETA